MAAGRSGPAAGRAPPPPKEPFRIGVALQRVRRAIRPFPRATLFELYQRGIRSLFGQLVACILSIRTRDEVSLPAALALLETAPDAARLARLSEARIDRLIRECTFHRAKAAQLRDMARSIVAEFGGEPPDRFDRLVEFRGVGPKCAGLALGIARGEARIGVDTHVHRVTNRWGYVEAPTPEATMAALEARLPRRYWIEINALLVPFGKHICTGRLPRCSTCPVLSMCRQVGVTRHR